jgi:hypothetical protein
MRLVAFAVFVVAYVLAGPASGVHAQQPQGTPGMQEGVTVHGDWVIEVRNPDGSLAHRRAFKNALVGGPLVASLLARTYSAGGWSIFLDGDACSPFNRDIACVIRESDGQLAVSLAPGGSQVVLTGIVTASDPSASLVTAVKTSLAVCDPGVVPAANCPAITTAPFSSVALPVPVPITFGQMAAVTVTFSFS